MELTKKLNVPVEYFYNVIVKSVLSDIQTETNTNVTEQQLKGYEYVKTFSKNAQATIRIEDIAKDELYQYRTSSTKNDFLVTYDIRPLKEEKCELRYSEKMESRGGFMQKLNDAFVGIIWSWLKKRKFNEMLRQIEASYSNQRVDG